MFRAIKRLFIWMGLMAEKATETDAINQAVVERGIRDSKAKADKAHYANGQLAGQIALLRDQIKRQDRQKQELESLLQAAAAANDEANGSHYAEELATLETDLNENKSQADNLEALYKQNNEIIAESLRELQRFQREFEAVKAKWANPCSNCGNPPPPAKARCGLRWTWPRRWAPGFPDSKRRAKCVERCSSRNTKRRWAWSSRR